MLFYVRFKGAISDSHSPETLVSSFRDLLRSLESADDAPAPLVFWNVSLGVFFVFLFQQSLIYYCYRKAP